MQEYYPILEKAPLFHGISMEELGLLLGCIGGRTVRFSKDSVIFHEGDPATHAGLVLRGMLQIRRQDYFGNRSIVTHAEPGALFAETYACADVSALPVSVVAATDCVVLLMDCRRITSGCCNACAFHNRIIKNLLGLVAEKTLQLDQKLQILSRRSTREKLMAYLRHQATVQQSRSFVIPYDRQELADYLEVDRSGLSAEISRLRKEQVLLCEKNRFTLL